MPPETDNQPGSANNAAEEEQYSKERPKDHCRGPWDRGRQAPRSSRKIARLRLPLRVAFSVSHQNILSLADNGCT